LFAAGVEDWQKKQREPALFGGEEREKAFDAQRKAKKKMSSLSLLLSENEENDTSSLSFFSSVGRIGAFSLLPLFSLSPCLFLIFEKRCRDTTRHTLPPRGTPMEAEGTGMEAAGRGYVSFKKKRKKRERERERASRAAPSWFGGDERQVLFFLFLPPWLPSFPRFLLSFSSSSVASSTCSFS